MDIYLLVFTKIIAQFIYKWFGITNYTLTKICLILSGIINLFIIFVCLLKSELSLALAQSFLLFILYVDWGRLKVNLQSSGKFLNSGRINLYMKIRRLIFFIIILVFISYSDWDYVSFYFFWLMALCFGSIESEDPTDSMLKKALNFLSKIFSPSPVPQMG